MSMTTDLLSTMGRKPLYKALETWLVEHYDLLDDELGTNPEETDAPQACQDFLNIMLAIRNIVVSESNETVSQPKGRGLRANINE